MFGMSIRIEASPQIPEATALNLLDTADPSADSSISVRIQHFFAFVLEYLSKEGEQNVWRILSVHVWNVYEIRLAAWRTIIFNQIRIRLRGVACH